MSSDWEPDWSKTGPVQVQFFCWFSRFEYALKRSGYLAKSKVAGADWDKFAAKLNSGFSSSVKTNAGVLLSQPPRKQVIKNDVLAWKDMPKPQDNTELFKAVRRVRNNLFHGGKYPSVTVADPIRNEALMRACLCVLRQALEECGKSNDSKLKNVQQVFFEGP